MNAPAEMWPKLSELIEDGITIEKLDRRAAPYPPERLLKLRDQHKENADFTELLNQLLSSDALLKNLNPKQAADIRADNIALHYLVATKKLPAKRLAKARGRVADLWNVTDQYVKDILTADRRAAATVWLEKLIEYRDQRSEFLTREDINAKILPALDADLTSRASSMKTMGLGRKQKKDR